MVTAYRAIRKAEYGEVTVWLAQNDKDRLAYLIYTGDTALAERLHSPNLPLERGFTAFEGVTCSVLAVPEGISLEQLKPTITEQGVFDVLKALVSALTALAEAGFPMPTGLIDERMLVLDTSGTWRVDFAAAYLAAGENQAAQLAAPEADVTRLCFGLLSSQRLGKSSKALRSLEWVCRARPPKSLADWQALLVRLQQKPSGIPLTRGLAVVLGAAVVTVVLLMRFIPSGSEPPKAKPAAKPEPAPVVSPTPVAEAPKVTAPATPAPTAPVATPVAREQIPGPVHDVLPGFPRSWRPDSYKVEEEKKLAPGTVTTPARPVTLPGPYCEASGADTAGSTRYLQVDGTRICTAHLLFWGSTYISFDAIARIANTDIGRLPDDEFVRSYGRTWILLRQTSLNRFGLSIEGLDGTTVYLKRL